MDQSPAISPRPTPLPAPDRPSTPSLDQLPSPPSPTPITHIVWGRGRRRRGPTTPHPKPNPGGRAVHRCVHPWAAAIRAVGLRVRGLVTLLLLNRHKACATRATVALTVPENAVPADRPEVPILTSPTVVSAVFTEDDVEAIAEEQEIDLAVARERLARWAKDIEQRLVELGNEQIESVVVHGSP